MKHAGSTEALKAQATNAGLPPVERPPPWRDPGSQSLTSKLIVLAAGLLLVAVTVDAPVRALALSLDPSVRSVLRVVTGFGNSAWPLGIGFLLLGLVALVRRFGTPPPTEVLQAFRAMLILVMGSVALSGFLASLTKHIIGRIRPSTDQTAMVLEFSFMAFKSGWAAFPSGHATTATAAAVALALCFPRQAWAWLAIGLLAALSRALLGVHWFTDCVAGVGLGAVVTVLLHRRMVTAGYRHEHASGALAGIAAATASSLGGIARWAGKRMVTAIRGSDRLF